MFGLGQLLLKFMGDECRAQDTHFHSMTSVWRVTMPTQACQGYIFALSSACSKSVVFSGNGPEAMEQAGKERCICFQDPERWYWCLVVKLSRCTQ